MCCGLLNSQLGLAALGMQAWGCLACMQLLECMRADCLTKGHVPTAQPSSALLGLLHWINGVTALEDLRGYVYIQQV